MMRNYVFISETRYQTEFFLLSYPVKESNYDASTALEIPFNKKGGHCLLLYQ
ncbi:hypothetical protein ACMGDK_03800 [Chryseobacterium sp. DT-3]|uniref:hypothetical protein n=1 Tax=Chryseobacterium sp. DT-3 TaxID=3396164 RepID=UPI003F1DE82A